MRISKANQKLQQQLAAQRQVQHFGLRKLSVGVVSVLLSTSLYFGATSVAHAANGTPNQASTATFAREAPVDDKVDQKSPSSAVGLKDATPVPPVSGQDRASIGSISKETVDLSGTPVYDDFNTWAGYSTNEFGPNKTISVGVTQDANNPNLKHYEITFLPTSRFYNGDGNRDYKMSNARMGFALSKDLTIVGNINFKTYYYLNNADNFKDGKTSDAKVLDKEFLIDHGKLYDAQGHSLSKVFYSDYGAWSNAWSQARRDANYSHDQSLLISNMKYADNATQVHNHFFNDVPGWDGTSPRVSYWGQREVQRQGNGMGMFAESITMNADSNPSTKGQYNQADFTQAYMWKSWGAWNNTQAGTYTVSFDAISNPDIKAEQTFSGVITAFGTFQGSSSYYYGHLTGEEISKVREYKNITVQVEDKFDTKGLENVTMPEREITIGYQKITNEVEGANGVIYTVENPYDQYKNISDKYPSTVVNTGNTFTHQYSVNVIVPKAGTQVVYLDANQTAPAKTADGKNLMADEYTPEDVAKDTGVTAPEIKGYTLTQTRSFDAKTGTLTVTNNYVRTVPLEELSKEVTDYTTKVKDFLSYVTSDDFFNAWKYNPTDQTVTPPQDSSTAYEEAYKTRLAALNDAAKTLKNDISALDPANYAEYGYQYNSLLDTYTRAVAPFDSSTGTLVKDLSTLYTDLSNQDPQTGKLVLDWSNLPIDGQANGSIYRSNLSDSLSSWMRTIGSKRTPGTIIKGIYDLVDGAENIKTTPRYTEASQPRQAAFDQALKNLKPQLTNVTNFKDLGDYYNLMDSQNKLKEAIYRLDHVTPTEDTTVTYTFYDETDKKPVEGHDVTVTGQPGTDQKVNLTTPEGYKLAEGQTLPTSVMMPNANETITINLVHATKDIKPNDPGVNPSDPVYADMFKTVTRTIKVNNPDRMVDTTTQQVNFNRTKTIDEVTDEVISYGNWTLATGSAKDWGQFNVPQLDGFISYVDGNAAKEVAEENVTADTADVTVEVTYKNSGNNGNNTTPGDDGNHNTNPGDNGNHNTNPGNNGNNNGINNGTQNGNSDETVNTNVTNNGNGDNSQNNKQALPQTGNTKNDAAVAGLGLAGLLAMLGLGGLKKKRN
ncbi:mucin-binding protein [Limosilactobacillus reuteri]|uniref:mucin-binding protein n=1 Tax=Limosilactobacillus reuteri TaxID=1598 RepID=UPI001E49F768|nr:YSIRK-type signal peptide-containing protein [Limosilactobacillus reuteri]MCC4483139.1 YSIRK-type signal peptide-containing protein [Limosilactobacillus reuteri]